MTPDDRRRPGARPPAALEGPRAGVVLRRARRQGLHSGRRRWRASRRFDSPLGHHPDARADRRASRSRAARSVTGCRSPSAARSRCGRTGRTAPRVFCVLGDGELAEGSNHEAIALAGRLGLDRLVADRRRQLQRDLRLAGRHRRALRGRGLDDRERARARPRRARAGHRRRAIPDGRTPSSRWWRHERGDHAAALHARHLGGARRRSAAGRRAGRHRRRRLRAAGARAAASRARDQRRHPRAAHDRRRRRPRTGRPAPGRPQLRAVPRRAPVRADQARPRPPGRRRACSSASARPTTPRPRAARTRRPATSPCSPRCPDSRSTCPATPTRSRSCCAASSPATAAPTCG